MVYHPSVRRCFFLFNIVCLFQYLVFSSTVFSTENHSEKPPLQAIKKENVCEQHLTVTLSWWKTFKLKWSLNRRLEKETKSYFKKDLTSYLINGPVLEQKRALEYFENKLPDLENTTVTVRYQLLHILLSYFKSSDESLRLRSALYLWKNRRHLTMQLREQVFDQVILEVLNGLKGKTTNLAVNETSDNQINWSAAMRKTIAEALDPMSFFNPSRGQDKTTSVNRTSAEEKSDETVESATEDQESGVSDQKFGKRFREINEEITKIETILNQFSFNSESMEVTRKANESVFELLNNSSFGDQYTADEFVIALLVLPFLKQSQFYRPDYLGHHGVLQVRLMSALSSLGPKNRTKSKLELVRHYEKNTSLQWVRSWALHLEAMYSPAFDLGEMKAGLENAYFLHPEIMGPGIILGLFHITNRIHRVSHSGIDNLFDYAVELNKKLQFYYDWNFNLYTDFLISWYTYAAQRQQINPLPAVTVWDKKLCFSDSSIAKVYSCLNLIVGHHIEKQNALDRDPVLESMSLEQSANNEGEESQSSELQSMIGTLVSRFISGIDEVLQKNILQEEDLKNLFQRTVDLVSIDIISASELKPVILKNKEHLPGMHKIFHNILQILEEKHPEEPLKFNEEKFMKDWQAYEDFLDKNSQ